MSCGQYYKLTEKDYEWMPYKGNETLVFQSNTGDSDTIFLLEKDTLTAYPEAQSSNGIKYEVLSIACKHSDSYSVDNKQSYLENVFFEISRNKSNRSSIAIHLSAKDANFYRLNLIRIDSLVKQPSSTLRTKYGQFDDIYVIDGQDYLGNFYQRSDFVTKVYWSKSQGLIRYDKKAGVYWELEKKY